MSTGAGLPFTWTDIAGPKGSVKASSDIRKRNLASSWGALDNDPRVIYQLIVVVFRFT